MNKYPSDCYECFISKAEIRDEQRKADYQAVMDLYYALREIKATPTLKDLVKLAKRIKSD